jgi:hypothetical protein
MLKQFFSSVVPGARARRQMLAPFITALAGLTWGSLEAPSALAESRVDITPSIASFNPAANVLDEQGATAKFTDAIGFGGRLTIWLNENVAIEGAGHFVESSLDGEFLGDPAGSIGVSLFYGSGQIVVGVGKEKRLQLHGGFGVQGSNYDEVIEGGNILTGVLGVSAWAPLGQQVALRAGLDSHIHTQYFEFGDFRSEELMQYDMVFSVGLQFTPGGR